MALPKMPPMKGKSAPKAAKPAADKKKPAAAAEPTEKKKHERKAKPSEADKIARGKALAVSYLAQRDGMELDMATMVVESMTPDEVNELVSESATAVMDKTAAASTAVMDKTAAASASAPAETADAEAEPVPVNFLEVESLSEFSFETNGVTFTLPELVAIAVEAAKRKNDSEKEYKAAKKAVLGAMEAANTPLVDCLGTGLAAYTGYTSQLSEELLLLAGVDADIIKACWKKTPFRDVRISAPKE